jgi:hypothetical protein
MELIRVYSDNWSCEGSGLRRLINTESTQTTGLMPFLDFPYELASENDVVVELVPQASCSEFRSWKLSKRMEEDSINDKANIINGKSDARKRNEE